MLPGTDGSTGGVSSPGADEEVHRDDSWMDVDVRTEALLDACRSGRAEGKLEVIHLLCKQQGWTKEHVMKMLEGPLTEEK
jgi:hypothetical protein